VALGNRTVIEASRPSGTVDGMTPRPSRRLAAELVTVWFLVPLLLGTGLLPGVHLLAALALAGGATALLAVAAGARGRALGLRRRGFGESLREGVPAVAAAVTLLPVVVVLLLGRDGLGPWPRVSALGLVGFLVVYAVVSVTAQEWLFSSFFFWRYRRLAPAPMLDAINVLSFGLAHLVYGSPISVGLSMLGRVVLVRIYRRRRNVWAVWVLHVVLGVVVFLVGLGRYFYRPLGPP
jgi:CAAX protease family protein